MRSMKWLTLAAAVFSVFLAGCGTTTQLDDGKTVAPVETRAVPGAAAAAAAAGVAAPVAVAGASTGATPQSRVATVDLERAGSSAAGAPGATAAAGAARTPAAAAAPSQRVVYFDFDSFVIKDEFKSLIEAHAKALMANRGKQAVVEGHTDERGGREYNLALGHKRAEAVLRSLTLLGVRESQLEAVSFGEERPAAPGGDESAWSRNRRAELKDR